MQQIKRHVYTVVNHQEAGNTSPGPDVRQFAPLISWVRAGEWSEAVDVFAHKK